MLVAVRERHGRPQEAAPVAMPEELSVEALLQEQVDSLTLQREFPSVMLVAM